MKTNFWFLVVLVLILGPIIGFNQTFAEDIIVNGITVTKPGGAYGRVLVINNGNLTVNGNLEAKLIVIETGTSVVSGNVSVIDSISIGGNNIAKFQVNGDSNFVNHLTVKAKGVLKALGDWQINNLQIRSEGLMSIIPYDKNIPKSGTIKIDADTLILKNGGHLSGDYAGNDPRGQGGGYGCSGGGAYGGDGGRGWWNATAFSYAYGDSFSFAADMGGAGCGYGGGALMVLAGQANLGGIITSNGDDIQGGGGAGGCVLLKTQHVIIGDSLKIFASGGNAPRGDCGGGGGGRIKFFHHNTGNNILLKKDLLIHCKVNGGLKGESHTGYGQPGTIYFDTIPDEPLLQTPDSQILVNQAPQFSFQVYDWSWQNENRTDRLLGKIEISTDSNFVHILKIYDQSLDLANWSKLYYLHGNQAIFIADDLLGIADTLKIYWRASVRDQSLYGEPSPVWSFTLIDTTVAAVGTQDDLPKFNFELKNNYPNPFNGTTKIVFSVPSGKLSNVELKIYNLLGQLVVTLRSEKLYPGLYENIWDGKDNFNNSVPAGIYFYRLQVDNFSQSKRLAFIK